MSTRAKSIKNLRYFFSMINLTKKILSNERNFLRQIHSFQLPWLLVCCKKLRVRRKKICSMSEHFSSGKNVLWMNTFHSTAARDHKINICDLVLISSIYGPKVTLPSLHLASSCHKVLPCQTGGWAMEVFMHNCRENLASQRWRSWRPGRLVQTQLHDYIL